MIHQKPIAISPNELVVAKHADGYVHVTEFLDFHRVYRFTDQEIDLLSQGEHILRNQKNTILRLQIFEDQENTLKKERTLNPISLDDQIEFMNRKRTRHLKDQDSKPAQMYLAIENNLKSIKHFNESPVYHGKVDVEKVIEDLCDALKSTNLSKERYEEVVESALQNAEAALGMLQAFKQDKIKKYPLTEKESFKPSEVEYEHYAPIRLGKWEGKDKLNQKYVCIISDTKTPHSDEGDTTYFYGGHLVAESVPYHIAMQLIEAYNEKYGDKQTKIWVGNGVEAKEIVLGSNPTDPRKPAIKKFAKSLQIHPADAEMALEAIREYMVN